jgi:hypothetical protein
MSPSAPLSVFISYSHRDEALKDDLVMHLATLKRQGKIRAWQDRDIEAGTEWDAEIQQQLESANIILLLITPRFLASDYCYDLEMQRALQRHEAGTARIIPIILKPCDWEATPFRKLQVLPKDAKPVTQWDDPDEAFLNIVQGIRRIVESRHSDQGISPEQTPPTALSATQDHNLTEKQQTLLKWIVREVRAGKLEEEIYFTWTSSGTIPANYQGTAPDIKPATLDALQNEGCLVCEHKTNNRYRFVLTRRAYNIAASISDIETEKSDTAKKAMGATAFPTTLPVAPHLTTHDLTASSASDASQRLDLFQRLSKLPSPQFEQLLFALNPPQGNLPSAQAPQSNQVRALLEWATSIGPGLTAVETVYNQVVFPH